MKRKEILPAILLTGIPLLLLIAVIALSFIIPAVGWRPMKNLELTKAVHYYGPLKQYTFSEEETAEIEQQLRSLVVYGERKDAEPMDGYAGYYLLTDKKGKERSVEVVIGGGEEGLVCWVTIDGVKYNCDPEQLRPLDEMLDESWRSHFSPVLSQ